MKSVNLLLTEVDSLMNLADIPETERISLHEYLEIDNDVPTEAPIPVELVIDNESLFVDSGDDGDEPELITESFAQPQPSLAEALQATDILLQRKDIPSETRKHISDLRSEWQRFQETQLRQSRIEEFWKNQEQN